MAEAVAVCCWVLLLSGSLFCVVGGIGLLRLPDFFTRAHGAGITDTLGTALLIAGMAVYHEGGLLLQYLDGAIAAGELFRGSLVTFKLILILLILWLSSPTATHAIAKAARLSGLEPLTDGAGDRSP